ncbi:hypothetical protein DPEC_G00070740 [Dallia pectoralis]|uniref:Uncharacterized protein n=1 Tax=Dallia pectoralis TaxID=75939 RepID=A0ACC2H234_DALPE|nr:hypothetical protein DPEC_G00070740 [Dallia pectoralis]
MGQNQLNRFQFQQVDVALAPRPHAPYRLSLSHAPPQPVSDASVKTCVIADTAQRDRWVSPIIQIPRQGIRNYQHAPTVTHRVYSLSSKPTLQGAHMQQPQRYDCVSGRHEP